MEVNYLAHHGVLGMKWGVRRYQNYDGTLTAEGRRRKSGEKERELGLSAEAASIALTAGVLLSELSVLGIKTGLSYANEKRHLKLRDLNSKTDKNTGIPLKDHSMTMVEDARAVNPGYKQVLRYPEYQNSIRNCPYCSMSYDLRRRGFDVLAGYSPIGMTDPEMLKFYKGAKQQSISDINQDTGKRSTRAMSDNLKHTVLSQGDNSRGFISFVWKDSLYSGHVMNYEVSNGKLTLVDSQCGKTYTDWFADRYISRMKDIAVTRTDNLTPNYEAMKERGIYR